LPKRLFDEPLKGGRSELQQELDLYYRMSGWDVDTGLPTQAKLKELGLEWIEF
jgi:aldehyde:ferredoxin oxidoreductase